MHLTAVVYKKLESSPRRFAPAELVFIDNSSQVHKQVKLFLLKGSLGSLRILRVSMMMRYIISALSAFQSATNMEQVALLLRKEVLKIIMRIFIGIIFSGVIIVSMFQLGGLYQDWLKQFANGLAIGVISYSSLIIVSSLILYFLFGESSLNELSKSKTLSADQSVEQSMEAPVNHSMARGVELLALKFAEGFIEGYEKR